MKGLQLFLAQELRLAASVFPAIDFMARQRDNSWMGLTSGMTSLQIEI